MWVLHWCRFGTRWAAASIIWVRHQTFRVRHPAPVRTLCRRTRCRWNICRSHRRSPCATGAVKRSSSPNWRFREPVGPRRAPSSSSTAPPPAAASTDRTRPPFSAGASPRQRSRKLRGRGSSPSRNPLQPYITRKSTHSHPFNLNLSSRCPSEHQARHSSLKLPNIEITNPVLSCR